MLLTGRAEGFIAGVPDLEQMIARLKAYAAAGADVLYAPGIKTREQIEAVVQGGRAEAGELPQRRGVRAYGGGSRRHGRAAHQRRRRAGARRPGAASRACAKQIAEQGSFEGFKDAANGGELNGFFTKDKAARDA